MTETPEIRRYPNGSIDLDHYARIGRALRGAAIRSAAGRGASAPNRLIAWLTTTLGRRRHSDCIADTAIQIVPAE